MIVVVFLKFIYQTNKKPLLEENAKRYLFVYSPARALKFNQYLSNILFNLSIRLFLLQCDQGILNVNIWTVKLSKRFSVT